jgi:hypothetical protein
MEVSGDERLYLRAVPAAVSRENGTHDVDVSVSSHDQPPLTPGAAS